MTVAPEDYDQLDAILKLQREEPSPSRDARLVEMTARADDLGYRHAAFVARSSEATMALQVGDLDRMARALGWLDQHFREEQAELHPTIGVYVAGSFSKALDLTLGMTQVTYAQNRGLIETLHYWCRRLGYSPRMGYFYGFSLACVTGEEDAALDLLRRWRAEPDDGRLARVDWVYPAIAWLGEHGRAAEAVALHDDELAHDPPPSQRALMASAVLGPLEDLGRGREAARLFRRRDADAAGPDSDGRVLPWCARTGHLDEGLEMVTRWAVMLEPEFGVDDGRWLLDLARRTVVLLDAAVQAGRGDETVWLQLPDVDDDVAAYLRDRSRPVTEVREQFRDRALAIAGRVDEVNGGDSARAALAAYWSSHGVQEAPC